MGVPLVGREAGLAAVGQALAALTGRTPPAGVGPRVMAVCGEPGIGKSCLLAELAARADRQGFLVLDARAGEFEGDQPFAVFAGALDDYLATVSRREAAAAGPADMARLAAVFPSLAGQARRPDVPGADERYGIHRAVRSLLSRLARPVPLVLVLDDVHWADRASAELLIHLLTRPPPGRVLIAVGYRPAQLARRLRAALGHAEVAGRVSAVRLGPLSLADADRLIGPELPPAVRQQINAESGGNPFYLLELAASARRGRQLDSHRASAGVPAAVMAAIDSEIIMLPAAARLLVQGAAVAGEPFDAETARWAAGIGEADCLPVLDQVAASGLIGPTEVPGRFEFRHPLVRRAIYQYAGPAWRIGAHRRLLAALRARGSPQAELARHVEASARPGDEEAAELLTAVGRALAGQAPAIAARRFGAALRVMPRDETYIAQRIDLLARLAAAHAAAGNLPASRDAVLAALGLLPGRQAGARVRLEASCAAVEQLLGLHAQAHARLRGALDSLPDHRSAEAAGLMIELAADAMWTMDWDGMRHWAGQARQAAAGSADRAAEATALALAAYGELCAAAPARAGRPLGAAAELVDAMPDAKLGSRPDAAFYLLYAEYFLERYEDAVWHADRGLALARDTGHGQFAVPVLTGKAAALRRLGRLPAAMAAADEADGRARPAGQDQLLLFALWARAWVATAAGEVDIAVTAGEEGLATTARLATSPLNAAGAWMFGEALLDAAQPERCIAVALDLAGGPQASRLQPGERSYTWHLLARAETQLGRYQAAQDWIERISTEAAMLAPLQMPRFLAAAARAHLLLARGEPAAAAAAACDAAEAADRVHARLDAARARLLAGRALAACGDRDGAVEALERARAELDQSGARRYRDQAARELRRLGRRISRTGPRASTRTGIQALSSRELAIAELAAAGKTNNQIAAELYLSHKTIERHLSHVYHKLGLTSRAQLGRLLR